MRKLYLFVSTLGFFAMSNATWALGPANGTQVVAVPEPTTIAASLVVGGLLAGAMFLRRRPAK